MSKPAVLFYDLETGFNLATIFSLHHPEKYIPYKAIRKERYIICGSWKWQGQKRVNAVSVLDDPSRFDISPTDDYEVVAKLHSILSTADAIVAHYGDNFDIKFFNTRALYHGFSPIPSVIQIDTCKMAKQKFLFNSNALDYLGQFLGIGKKITTHFQLWLDCFNGKKKAIRGMVKYNKQDVILLEEVYNALAPYCDSKLNNNLFTNNRVCPSCGSSSLTRQGFKYTRVAVKQQVQCKDCGHWASYPVSKAGNMGVIR